jgi:hypothetical protein
VPVVVAQPMMPIFWNCFVSAKTLAEIAVFQSMLREKTPSQQAESQFSGFVACYRSQLDYKIRDVRPGFEKEPYFLDEQKS